MRSAVTRILAAAGIAAGLAWAGAVMYCGAIRQGYDPVNQFVSELAERGSSTEFVMRITGFYVPGLLVLAFAAFLLLRSAGWVVAVLLIELVPASTESKILSRSTMNRLLTVSPLTRATTTSPIVMTPAEAEGNSRLSCVGLSSTGRCSLLASPERSARFNLTGTVSCRIDDRGMSAREQPR